MGGKRQRARGYLWFYGFAGYYFEKNLGNNSNKDSDKISCRFWQHFRHAFEQPLPPERNDEFPKVVKQDKNLDFLFRNNSGTAYLVAG